MSYGIAQYIKQDADNDFFMTPTSDGVVRLVKKGAYRNPGLYFTNGLSQNNYYLHCQIKRTDVDQIFNIQLVNYDAPDDNMQSIKTVTIYAGDTAEWVDVECIFHPFVTFDAIVFELQREEEEEVLSYPSVLYLELSVLNNLITQEKLNITNVAKLGVQADPGFLMCINDEEIRVGKSGIYEIKKGYINVVFFSAVAGLNVPQASLSTLQSKANAAGNGGGYCAFKDVIQLGLNRIINSFIFDYLYEEV